MPVPVPVTQPCNKCGASKLVFSSDPWKSYLQTQVKSLGVTEEQKNDTQAFITVNTKQFNLSTTGFLAVTVDACTGNVIKHMVFLKQDSTMVQYFKAGIPARSIVLLASRGQPDGFDGVAQHLVPLGAAKVADLQGKESLSFFGFQGASSPPSWVSLLMNQGKEVVEKYIPLSLDEYLCSPDTEPPQRKDLELLRKAGN
ncbi:cell surface hyaluronidase [Tachysurus ichikawai]